MDMNIHVYWQFCIQPSIDVRFGFKVCPYLILVNVEFQYDSSICLPGREKKPSVTLIVKKKDWRDVAGKYCLSVALNNS